MGLLQGKVALVSGARGGIGTAICAAFEAEGAIVLAGDVVPSKPGDTAGASMQVDLDVTKSASWQATVDMALERFGRLDILVNNAGICPMETFDEQTEEGFLDVVRINQLGVLLGIMAAAVAMRQGGGGSIVNLASMAGLVGSPRGMAYSASKWAVRGITKSAALQLASDRIRVNAVLPGFIDTPMIAGTIAATPYAAWEASVPLRRPGQATEIANAIVYLASDQSSYCTGAELVCDGGVTSTITLRP